MLIQQLEHKQDYDLYDVLAEIGYGLAPRTRTQRAEAFQYKHAAWLSGLPKTSADVLGAIVGQFAIAGTDGIENRSIFEIADVKKAAGPKGLSPLRGFVVGRTSDLGLTPQALCCRRSATKNTKLRSSVSVKPGASAPGTMKTRTMKLRSSDR